MKIVKPPAAPVIILSESLSTNKSGCQASVDATPYSSFLWTIENQGGIITDGATKSTVTFRTFEAEKITLTCTVTNTAGTQVKGSATFQTLQLTSGEQYMMDTLNRIQKANEIKVPRPNAVAADARCLYEMVFGKAPPDCLPDILVSKVIQELDKRSAKDGKGPTSEDAQIKGKSLVDQENRLFQLLNYPDWREEQVRFSVLLGSCQTPSWTGQSSMTNISGVFRAYFTPHRFIPGEWTAYNNLRRCSAFVGLGQPLSAQDRSQLADSTVITAGLGFDLAYEYTLMVGVSNYRINPNPLPSSTTDSSRRVNSFTIGIAINSEFFRPLIGLSK
jgi:hypothetical protein